MVLYRIGYGSIGFSKNRLCTATCLQLLLALFAYRVLLDVAENSRRRCCDDIIIGINVRSFVHHGRNQCTPGRQFATRCSINKRWPRRLMILPNSHFATARIYIRVVRHKRGATMKLSVSICPAYWHRAAAIIQRSSRLSRDQGGAGGRECVGTGD